MLNNITETFNSNTYAMDAVMALALALNETINQNQQMAMGMGGSAQFTTVNQNLSAALQSTTFTGASVSESYAHIY